MSWMSLEESGTDEENLSDALMFWYSCARERVYAGSKKKRETSGQQAYICMMFVI